MMETSGKSSVIKSSIIIIGVAGARIHVPRIPFTHQNAPNTTQWASPAEGILIMLSKIKIIIGQESTVVELTRIIKWGHDWPFASKFSWNAEIIT